MQRGLVASAVASGSAVSIDGLTSRADDLSEVSGTCDPSVCAACSAWHGLGNAASSSDSVGGGMNGKTSGVLSGHTKDDSRSKLCSVLESNLGRPWYDALKDG